MYIKTMGSHTHLLQSLHPYHLSGRINKINEVTGIGIFCNHHVATNNVTANTALGASAKPVMAGIK